MNMTQTLLVDRASVGRSFRGLSLATYFAVDAATGNLVAKVTTDEGAVIGVRDLLRVCAHGWGTPLAIMTDCAACFTDGDLRAFLDGYGVTHQVLRPGLDAGIAAKMERAWMTETRRTALEQGLNHA